MNRILITDDHEIFRRGLKGILTDAFPNFGITEAINRTQTLEVLRKHNFDIVLLDINLPGQSGLDILQELKSLYPKLPVVVWSAFPEKDYALRAFKLGALAYVSKQ